MKKEIFAMFVLCAVFVQAQVVIEQVYPNPRTESGSEAVLLRNAGNASVSLENWTIATQASVQDVVFPFVLLGPAQTFLVADVGWSEKKDDLNWRNADLEATLTLANEDGGIALVDNAGKTVDALGWGNSANMRTPLFTGSPAPIPPEQKALVRKSYSGNNAQDFVVADPSFEAEDTILIVVNVGNGSVAIKEVIVLPDENGRDGVQVSPPQSGTKRIIVRAVVEGVVDELQAVLANQTVDLELVNGSVYEGSFHLSQTFPAGIYAIEVVAGNSRKSASFEYLPVKHLSLDRNLVDVESVPGARASGFVLAQNNGNAPLRLQAALVNNSIGTVQVSLDGILFKRPEDVTFELAAGQFRKVYFAVDMPAGTKAGVYRTRLRLRDVS